MISNKLYVTQPIGCCITVMTVYIPVLSGEIGEGNLELTSHQYRSLEI